LQSDQSSKAEFPLSDSEQRSKCASPQVCGVFQQPAAGASQQTLSPVAIFLIRLIAIKKSLQPSTIYDWEMSASL
jgi:hypothetical protein